MAMTGAERQKRYRERNGSNAGKRRINLVVPAAVAVKLDELAQQYGVFKQVMLERAILEYKALRRNSNGVVHEASEKVAGRLLQLTGGDVTRAVVLLHKEAGQCVSGVSRKQSVSKRSSAEGQPVRHKQKRLSDLQQQSVADGERVDCSSGPDSGQLLLEF